MPSKDLSKVTISSDSEEFRVLDTFSRFAEWERLRACIRAIEDQVGRGEGDRRAVQLQIPTVLINAIDRAAKASGRTKISVLIEAVREYRARYPIPPGWVEPETVWEARPESRKAKTVTLRFPEDDRELIRNIGRGRKGVSDRYTAFLEIAEILDQMHARDDPAQKQTVKLPSQVASQLQIAASVTKRPLSRVLSDALRRFAVRNAEVDGTKVVDAPNDTSVQS